MSAALYEARKAAMKKVDALGVVASERQLTVDERRRFEDAMADVADIDERIEQAQADAARRSQGLPFRQRAESDILAAAKPPTNGDTSSTSSGFDSVSVRSSAPDSGDYHEGPESPSFVHDAIAWRAGTANDAQRARIERHQNWAVETRALSTTDSEGGYLVAPAYLQNDFLDLKVQKAPILAHIGRRALPNGGKTDTVNIPRIASGTQVTYATQNSSLPETDATFGTVAATVFRLGGLQKASNFVMDRSMPGVDKVIMGDLAAQLWKKVGTEVINGAGPSNAFEGILQADSIGTSTATAGTATLSDLHPAILNAVYDVQSAHYSLDGVVIVMHPRRWMWILAQLDSEKRPLVDLGAGAAYNVAGGMSTMGAEGIVGSYANIPVVLDFGIPTNLGSGTDEDRIIVGVLREACVLVEDTPKFAVDFSAGFDTDSARMRVTYDAAFSPELYPGAISVVSGTALNDV